MLPFCSVFREAAVTSLPHASHKAEGRININKL